MQRGRRIVAAALIGGVATTLAVATLASGAGSRGSAVVTLQVAPRGPGSVSATPVGGGDASPCTGQAAENDCKWTYERGTTVRLTARTDPGPGRSFAGWSDPDCGSASSCTVSLDGDLTSVVARFSPLMLAVRFSEEDGGATVTSSPAGQPCDPAAEPGNAAFCRTFAPGTRVTLTLSPGTTPFRGWNEQGDYLCEPTGSATCSILVEDQPTWAGARFAGEPAPPLPTTISVEFRLRKSGNGSGRVTASRLDCGTVCSATYGFGRTVALTADPDDGSLFDGWNGVCATTQTTCTFPAGPITSIRAVFRRDATAPSAPGAPAIGSRTRTSVAISWAPATDDDRVTGYRIYVDGVAAGETQATEYTLQGLSCGRDYAVSIEAVDVAGNRSQRAGTTVQTQPCPLAARLAGVGVGRVAGLRTVVAALRVNRPRTARLRLLREGRAVASGRFAVQPGTNRLRLRVPRAHPAGRYRLATIVVNPDGGTLVLPGRGVLLPRP